jgi:hypothetical protein
MCCSAILFSPRSDLLLKVVIEVKWVTGYGLRLLVCPPPNQNKGSGGADRFEETGPLAPDIQLQYYRTYSTKVLIKTIFIYLNIITSRLLAQYEASSSSLGLTLQPL